MALDDLDGEKVGQQFLVHILKGHHWSRSTADHALKFLTPHPLNRIPRVPKSFYCYGSH